LGEEGWKLLFCVENKTKKAGCSKTLNRVRERGSAFWNSLPF
jgi:hypothetical protein